jgi:hypothetical protein
MHIGDLFEVHCYSCVSHLVNSLVHCVFITNCNKLKMMALSDIVHAKFREHWASVSKSAFEGAMIDIACETCSKGCKRN